MKTLPQYHCDAQIEQWQAAYQQSAGEPPWVRAQLGALLSMAHCERGWLRQATDYAGAAWEHALGGQRLAEGIATAEVIGGYQQAAAARFTVEALTNGPVGLAQAIEDMVTVYRRSHDKLDEFNRHSVIPLANPGGSVVPEDVQAGEPSAELALLEGRADEAVAILDRAFPRIGDRHKGTREYTSLQVLRLEAASVAKATWDQDNALAALQAIVDDQDIRWCACRLARIRARLDFRSGRPEDALQRLSAALPIASSWALGRYWLDLMTDSAALLRSLGRVEEARATVRMLLLGEATDPSQWWNDPGPAPEALHQGHREAILEGSRIFAGAESDIDGLTEARAELDQVVPRSTLPRRRPVNDDPERPPTGQEKHDQALEVLRARQEDGTPFILYLTAFGIVTGHTASPFGSELLENSILDGAPDKVNVIRIQEPSGLDNFGLMEHRRLPALSLNDDSWKEMAEALIFYADLIISEAIILRPGVRFELERAYKFGGWDRTILILPPLRSPYATVDGDPLVQMFPFCVWADELHTHQLFDLPIVKPMIDRLRALASLPADELRALVDPTVRAAFKPLSLDAVASELTREMRMDMAFGAEDDRAPYYSFWKLFRAAALRTVLFTKGEATDDILFGLASNQLEMSTAMLSHEIKDEKITFKGDLDTGEKMAISARNIFRSLNHIFAPQMAEVAERRVSEYRAVKGAVHTDPTRFHISPIFGPFVSR